MILKFKQVAIITALVFLSLAVILVSAPDLILASWGVEFSASVGVVARRGAALYIGIAVMFFLARNSEHSTARTALIYGMITSCLILAALGAYEVATGNAASGILPAIFIEIALVIAFTYVGCSRQSKCQLKV
jgi:lysylphosphatidylglycerol synthetase-like protein (DUF2156 family)